MASRMAAGSVAQHCWRALGITALASTLLACAVNPVTGDRELTLIGEQQELSIGREQYAPTRQQQGGDYVADPQLLKYVQGVGARIAKVADRKLDYEFHIVNDSAANAWALPGGKIALNRGLLLALNNEAELAAVLAHEVVHAAARHSAQQIERGLLLQGAVLATSVTLADSEYRQLGVLGANLGASLTKQAYGRDAEREADAYGIRYMVRAGYDPAASIALQETFVKLSADKKASWLDDLFASHPPSPERVENNRKLVKDLGSPGGELGEAAYQNAIAHLKRTEPAYEAYAKAQKAFEEKRTDEALRLLDEARAIEPNEAMFDTLEGQIQSARGKNAQALKAYTQALSKQDDYFVPYLLRGLLLQKLGGGAQAQSDLQTSARLLPTAEAHYGLGLLAQASGDNRQALVHLGKAAKATSPAGVHAQTLLARLQMANKPKAYFKTQLLAKRDGFVYLRVTNQAPIAARELVLELVQHDGLLLRRLQTLRLPGPLDAGASVDVRTGLRNEQAKKLKGLAGRVSAAQADKN